MALNLFENVIDENALDKLTSSELELLSQILDKAGY